MKCTTHTSESNTDLSVCMSINHCVVCQGCFWPTTLAPSPRVCWYAYGGLPRQKESLRLPPRPSAGLLFILWRSRQRKYCVLPTLQERFIVTQSGSADIKDHIKTTEHKRWFQAMCAEATVRHADENSFAACISACKCVCVRAWTFGRSSFEEWHCGPPSP